MIQDDFRLTGWIKLHRKLLKWRWYKVPHMTRLFIHLMLRANWTTGISKGNEIYIGQFPTSLQELSDDTGISVRSIRTCLKRMVATKEIDMEATSIGRIITVRNWLKHQQLESGVDYNAIENDNNATSKTTKESTNISTNKNNHKRPEKTINTESENEKATKQTTKESTKNATTIEEYKESIIKNKSDKITKETSTSVTDKKSDYLTQIVDSFRAKFQEFHGREYIITNKTHERVCAAKLLQVFKDKYPESNSDEMLRHLTNYFSYAISISDKWLRNNMSIPISFSRYNAITNILNDNKFKINNERSKNKQPEQQPASFNVTNWD